MRRVPPLPSRIGDIGIPHDPIAAETWRWAHRSLPEYLLAHSVRAYCWGAALAGVEGWTFDSRILWVSSLIHDIGLTRIPRNSTCFEVEGAGIARRFVARQGMPAADSDRVASAIVLHMQPDVTLDDGVESVLLDRATGLDVRGVGYELVEEVRPAVMGAYPRRAFDRRFLAAMTREAAARPTCQGARLVQHTGLADWMARSPWAAVADG